MKSVQIGSFFCSVFSCIWTEYGPEKASYLDTFHAVLFFPLDEVFTQRFATISVDIICDENAAIESLGNEVDDYLKFVFDININLRYHLVTGVYLNVSFANDMGPTCVNISTLPNVLYPLQWCQSSWEADVVYQSPNIKILFLTEVRYQNKFEYFEDFTLILTNNNYKLNQSSPYGDLVLEFKLPKPGKMIHLI